MIDEKSIAIFKKLPKPDLVLFDWDNTILDTAPIILSSLNNVLRKYNKPLKKEEDFNSLSGGSLRKEFPIVFGDKWEEAKDFYLKSYKENHLKFFKVLDGGKEVLEIISKNICPIGIVSNKTNYILHEEIDFLKWNYMISAIVGSGDAKLDKPAPDVVYYAKDQVKKLMPNNELKNVWFVGDAPSDVECGKAANCTTIRLSEEWDNNADLTLKNCKELYLMIDNNGKNMYKSID
ncbi:MAG: HAD family hydrolase [Alphaproteobacteria bacterium]|nr:HAD family hydrolase [Alphaproteobacteria bacterium]